MSSGASRLLLFRFTFVYFVVYLFPFPFDLVPLVGAIASAPGKAVVPWVASHVLRLGRPVVFVESGSGDTTFAWVLLLVSLVGAALIAILWTIANRRVLDHPRLRQVLTVYVRYHLAFTMLSYGTVKVWKAQFPFPGPERLLEPYGQSTPMALLWTFMGYSTAYTFFAGFSECLGAVLLFWRRTTLLGALISAAVLGNVVLMNFCYDVPVKIYSTHLLVLALWLAAPDARRCADVLLGRATAPRAHLPHFPARWQENARLAAKLVIVVGLLAFTTHSGVSAWTKWGDAAPVSDLFGIYDVESYVHDGVAVPPLLSETRRWRRMFFNRTGGGGIQRMNDAFERFTLERDAEKRTLTLKPRNRTGEKATLTYDSAGGDVMTLEGSVDGEALLVVLRKRPPAVMPLVARGFHFVNEFPNNN